MKILAIDFSSSLRGVALAEADGAAVSVLGRAAERHGQATHAFALIESVLKQAGLARAAIDCLAIGLGPGSYAGIRVSLAIAQGWQLATAVKTVGIGTVECLAESARSRGVRGSASFVIDAQRGEYYVADYELKEHGLKAADPLRIVGKAEVDRRLATGATVFGPDASVVFPDARDLHPDAGVLAELASRRTDFVDAATLEPVYLREVNFVKAPPPSQAF